MLLSGVSMIGSSFYASRGVEQPVGLIFIDRVMWIWVIGWWLSVNARRRFVPYCPGLFVVSIGPFLALYVLLKTRGIKAFIFVALVLVVVVVASILGAVLGLVVQS